MLTLSGLDEWRAYTDERRSRGRRVGLVPTMGALHAGHVALVRAAKESGDVVVLTIFVNPRQFNDPRDLVDYPRTREHDYALAQRHGVDCLVAPTLESMWPDYPTSTPTTVSVGGLGDLFEGADRPGHFDGVASVVAKLFAVTGPARAYFGEKDYQQLAVVRQMVRDLGFNVDVVSCPVVRDPDGLALSSRNVRLSDDGRQRALSLSRALEAVAARRASAGAHRRTLRLILDEAGVETAYAEIVDPTTLAPSGDDEVGERRALIAAVVDGVRLLDNGPVTIEAGVKCC